MTRAEWESLCDGCGKCCVHKLEDEDTGELMPTNVSCRLLNRRTGLCSDYKHRQAYVPECVRLTAENIRKIDRSEEHTSELQSLMRISYAVFCLKKKNKQKKTKRHIPHKNNTTTKL